MKRTFSSLLLLAAMAFAGCPYATAQNGPVVEKIIQTGKTDNRTMEYLDVL